ncbi:MAG: T9SS type A sorting domain-containing protein [Bacteroidales bacterium]|nr:T9SS type A sorting domain-containing protein [Candidatus Latescibacterota bacterium]
MRPLFNSFQRSLKVIFVLTVCVVAAAAAVKGAWPTEGLSLTSDTYTQAAPKIVYDGAGGCIVAWEDSRSMPRKIYAQRLDGAGNEYWPSGGIQVSDWGDHRMIAMVPDDAGGAILIWFTDGTTVYAQRIDVDGASLWMTDGVAILADYFDDFLTVPDGAGGCLMVWEDPNGHIYAQKIDRNGDIAWDDPPGYVVVSDASSEETAPSLVCDGFGGALVAFESRRSDPSDVEIFVQRIFASGAVWNPDGVPVIMGHTVMEEPVVAADGYGGAYVCYRFDVSGQYDFFLVKVDASGALEWTREVCIESHIQRNADMIEDGYGGVFIAWSDERDSGRVIYAQRMDKFGNALWGTDGTLIIETDFDNDFPRLLPCETGFITLWIDGHDPSLFAQKVDITGGIRWDLNGVEVLVGDLRFYDYDIASDGACGLFATIIDNRGANIEDVFAQYIDALGDTSAPEPVIADVLDVPDDQGGYVRLEIDASDRDDNAQPLQLGRYDVWQQLGSMAASSAQEGPGVPVVSIHDGRTFMLMPGGGVVPAGTWELVASFDAAQMDTYSCRVPTLADSVSNKTPKSVYMVTGHTTDPAIWYASAPDSGHSVDNLTPAMPAGIAGEQQYAPEGLALTWDPNSENDFSHYVVYRGTSEDFIPTSPLMLATPMDPEWFDVTWTWEDEYWYKVSAIDVHKNESLFAVSGPGDVTGEELPDVPGAAYLAQNYPNPFNPGTSIAFGLASVSRVKLSVYDTSGRLVRTLLDEERNAGNFVERWDGLNSRGVPVASGVYYFRLTAESFDKTRKMLLLR